MAGWMATVRPEPDARGVLWFELPCCDTLASLPPVQWKFGEPVTRHCGTHGMTYEILPVPYKYLVGRSEFVLVAIAPEGVLYHHE